MIDDGGVWCWWILRMYMVWIDMGIDAVLISSRN